jgi:ATP-dependent exoDNAse (exonuclease V) beta subunit
MKQTPAATENMPPDLPDADARRLATEDFSRCLLVEAAAGTGKTRLIVERIAHIIRRGLATMPQIVAITFTEKAAGEMKIRIRQWLEQSLQQLSDPAQRRRLIIAIHDLERAQISTIHSFAAWMLKQLPVEAGVDPAFTVADALKSERLRAEVWNEWFRAQASLDEPPAPLRRALMHGLEVDDLHALAQKLCLHRDSIQFHGAALPAPDNPNRPAPLNQTSLARSVLDDALKILAATEPFTRSNPRTKTPEQNLQRIRAQLLDASTLDGIELESVLLHALTYDPGASKREHWKPPQHYDIVAKASQDLAALRLKISDSILRDVAEWMQGFLQAYELRKQREALLDFDDLLFKARDLLRDCPRARQYFKEKFRFILIDEFQDTDPAQTQIALFLSESNDAPATQRDWRQLQLQAGKLFIVGDPKQSIYRFRRADIEMYEEAKTVLGRNAALSICANFRTVRSLTDWVNRIFAPKIKRPNDGNYQPDYVPLLATRHARQKSPPRLLLLEPSQTERALIESDEAPCRADDVRALEANALAQTLKHLRGNADVWDRQTQQWRPAQWRDMAILLRSLNKLFIYEQALQDYAIPYQVEGGKDFFQRPEVRAVCALLLCLDNPANTRELVAVLRSSIFGIPDEQILLWKHAGNALDYNTPFDPNQDRVAAALACLRALHARRNQLSFCAFLELCYRELRLIELFALTHRGEQCVANLWKLLDMARAAQAAGMTSLRELARYIRDIALDLSEERQSPSVEEDDDVLRLITMHSAKGLEWNIVALADLGRWELNRRQTILVDRATGRLELSLRGLQTAQWDAAARREKARADAEESRLLYVAATRARDWLIVPFFETANRRGYFTSLLRDDFAAAQIEADPSVQRVDRKAIQTPRTPRPPVTVQADEPDAQQRGKLARLIAQRDEWIAARQRLLEEISGGRPRRRPSQHEEEQLAEIVKDGWQGRQIGALVHAALEAVAIKAPRAEQQRAANQFIAASAAADPLKTRAMQLVQTALGSNLWQRLRRSRRVLREVPFCVELEGKLVEGFMDVVFEENGRWNLADYKSDDLTPAQLEQRVEFYRSQMTTYAAAFERISGESFAQRILLFLALDREVHV